MTLWAHYPFGPAGAEMGVHLRVSEAWDFTASWGVVAARYADSIGEELEFADMATAEWVASPEWRLSEGRRREPLTLSRAAMQNLCDQLHAIGFRPKDGLGSEQHVGALKAHLADLRALVLPREGKG